MQHAPRRRALARLSHPPQPLAFTAKVAMVSFAVISNRSPESAVPAARPAAHPDL